jgi:rRNA maturation endonuclease Nob1
LHSDLLEIQDEIDDRNHCPGCGHEINEEDKECPSCGLGFVIEE